MAITSSGVGSGLNVESIVSQLLAFERQPLNALQRKKADYESDLSAYGRLSSAVSTFQTAMGKLDSLSDFRLFSAVPADETAYTASASSLAATGTYDVQVDRLAEAHKIKSKAFADVDTATVGGADLTLTIGADSFTVTGAGSLTLEGLRNAINDAADNVGVTASIISENATSNYLVLTSDNTGTDSAITLSGTVADAANLNPTNINTIANLDSQVLVDNTFTISRSTNTITDAIPGVTLNLKSTSVGNVNLKIDRDSESVTGVVQEFIDSYNALEDTINKLRLGELSGDNALLSIENSLKSVFNTPAVGLTTSNNYLVQVGVAFDKNGKLTLDSEDLQSAIDTDFDGLAELFADDNQGFAFRLKQAADNILLPDGLIDSREDGVNRSIDSTESRIDREEFRLELVEKRIRAQFTALDALVGTLTSTGDFLQSQLNSLNTNNK